MIVRMRVPGSFGWNAFAAQLGLLEPQASTFGCIPFACFGLRDQFVEVGSLIRGHFAGRMAFIDGLLHSREPGGIAGRTGCAQGRNQRQMIVLDSWRTASHGSHEHQENEE